MNKKMAKGKLLLLILLLAVEGCSQSGDSKVILVNIGDSDYSTIAKTVTKLTELRARVVAVDVALTEYDSIEHTELVNALNKCNRLVMPTTIDGMGEKLDGSEIGLITLAGDWHYYPSSAKTGFISGIVGDNGRLQERFIIKYRQRDWTYYSFSVQTAMLFDSLVTTRFINSHENFASLDWTKVNRTFAKFPVEKILYTSSAKADFSDKIVIIGYLGPEDIDCYYTPDHKADQDRIYGAEYLGIIVEHILGVE